MFFGYALPLFQRKCFLFFQFRKTIGTFISLVVQMNHSMTSQKRLDENFCSEREECRHVQSPDLIANDWQRERDFSREKSPVFCSLVFWPPSPPSSCRRPPDKMVKERKVAPAAERQGHCSVSLVQVMELVRFFFNGQLF